MDSARAGEVTLLDEPGPEAVPIRVVPVRALAGERPALAAGGELEIRVREDDHDGTAERHGDRRIAADVQDDPAGAHRTGRVPKDERSV